MFTGAGCVVVVVVVGAAEEEVDVGDGCGVEADNDIIDVIVEVVR